MLSEPRSKEQTLTFPHVSLSQLAPMKTRLTPTAETHPIILTRHSFCSPAKRHRVCWMILFCFVLNCSICRQCPAHNGVFKQAPCPSYQLLHSLTASEQTLCYHSIPAERVEEINSGSLRIRILHVISVQT